ncbi:MAG: HlyD family type I secretion periplasmic adaptor subunit [Pseudomonadota bacterium]
MPQPDINNETAASNAALSLKRNITVAFTVLGLFFGIGGAWVIFTQVSGAIIASGRLAVDTKVKRVQHPDGGAVEAIYVKDGDRVSEGQLLMKLNATNARTDYEINRKRLIEAQVLEARLRAELWEKTDLDLPASFSRNENDDLIRDVISNQWKLLRTRIQGLASRRNQLYAQIDQFENRYSGLRQVQDANEKQLTFLNKQIEALEELLDKQLTSASRVLTIKGTRASLQGEMGRIGSEMMSVENSINELRLEIAELNENRQSEVRELLQTTRAEISELIELSRASRQRLDNIEVRAPYSGIVHAMQFHAKGQVIRTGDDVLQIIPEDETLIVEAMVRPVDIDQVYIGQPTRLRMSALDTRTTPDLEAEVSYISGELVEDPLTRQQIYRIEAKIAAGEYEKLGKQVLLPGMSAEVFVQTSSRSVLSYLVDPLTTQIARTFRE